MGKFMNVIYGDKFKSHLKHFPAIDQLKIKKFVEHIEQYGFEGLTGRNKSSDNVPTTHPNWRERVKYVQDNQLWHYHIGIPNYSSSEQGDYTSEYVLHYIKGENFIKIIDLSPHPPLILPSEEYLKSWLAFYL